jgi:arylsulfatase
MPVGENLIISAAFVKDGEDPPGVSTGIVSLYHGDKKVGEGRIKTQPSMFGISGTDLTVGRSRSRVTDEFPGERPWSFTGGTIKTVAIDVSGEPYVDLEREAAAMIARE